RRALDAIGEFPHRLAQDLARPGLRQSGDDVDASERGDRSDLPAHQGDEFVDDSVRIGRLGGVAENDEGAGDLALDLGMDRDDGGLGHSRVGGDDGLDDAGRQAVTGDVDDIVGAPHDVDVAVLVEVAGVAGEVVAVEGGQVRGDEARVIAPYQIGRAHV